MTGAVATSRAFQAREMVTASLDSNGLVFFGGGGRAGYTAGRGIRGPGFREVMKS